MKTDELSGSFDVWFRDGSKYPSKWATVNNQVHFYNKKCIAFILKNACILKNALLFFQTVEFALKRMDSWSEQSDCLRGGRQYFEPRHGDCASTLVQNSAVNLHI